MHNFKTLITQNNKIACFMSWCKVYLKKYAKGLRTFKDWKIGSEGNK